MLMSAPSNDELKLRASQWLEIDNTPVHQRQIQQWLDEDSWTDLSESFSTRLQFGTAGLRGTVGPGPNSMNRGLVQQTALGIAHYVSNQNLRKTAIIGYDARIDSRQFAQDVADVLFHEGFTVHLFAKPVPTPLVAYGVLWLKTTVGIVITASHNPAPDNGFKVYWQNGAQIVPPTDVGIATAIDNIATQTVHHTHISNTVHPAPPSALIDEYFDTIQKLRVTQDTGAHFVYTPMHGVGGFAVQRALNEAGHNWRFVPEQAKPDGTFPTTRFPNPEEPDALHYAILEAERSHTDAILANDPDADRLAVALRADNDNWTRLTGDQVGLIFAHYLANTTALPEDTLFANTIVSSSVLRKMADAFGIQYSHTLTGFKWLANAGMAHFNRTGHPLLLGYEEALGYSLGGVVQDKDGVSALLMMADIISHYRQHGKTLWDVLDDIALQHGLSVSSQHSIKKFGLSGAAEINGIMNRLRQSPPTEIAGSQVIQREDYLSLERYDSEDGFRKGSTIDDMPSSNVLVFWLTNQERIIVRPSGTEPKIKFYFEATCTIQDRADIVESKAALLQRLHILWKETAQLIDNKG